MLVSPVKHKSSQGFTLTEILLVLGLIATIAIAAFVIYPKVRVSQDVGEAQQKYGLITGNIKEFFGGREFTGLTTSAIVTAGVLSQEDLTSPWGQIDVAATGTGNGMRVDFQSVPADACGKLVVVLEPSSSALRVGSTYIKTDTIPYSLNAGLAACRNATQIVSAWPGN